MRSRLLAIRAISQEPSNTDVQCDLALLADSIIEAKDRKISTIGIFDRIEAKPLPLTLESAVNVVRWKGRGTKNRMQALDFLSSIPIEERWKKRRD